VNGPIIGIDHVQVAAPAACEAAARRFYGGLLGLEEIPKPAALAARVRFVEARILRPVK